MILLPYVQSYEGNYLDRSFFFQSLLFQKHGKMLQVAMFSMVRSSNSLGKCRKLHISAPFFQVQQTGAALAYASESLKAEKVQQL